MRKVWPVIICLLMFSISGLIAQIEEQEEPVPPKRAVQAKLGGGLGLTSNWLMLDLDPLNRVLAGANATPFDHNSLFMTGGQVYAYVLFVPNVRVGFLGAGGSMESSSLEQSTNTRRSVDLSVGLGGASIDYVIPLMPRLDLTVGTVLGGGYMKLKMTRDDGTGKVWGDLWNEYGSQQPAQEYTRTLEGTFFVYQPSVNLEFAILRWLGVRAGVSYLGAVDADWKLDNTYDVSGVPDNVNAKGFMITAGVFVGTFVF
jgi:hypothetical protein